MKGFQKCSEKVLGKLQRNTELLMTAVRSVSHPPWLFVVSSTILQREVCRADCIAGSPTMNVALTILLAIAASETRHITVGRPGSDLQVLHFFSVKRLAMVFDKFRHAG